MTKIIDFLQKKETLKKHITLEQFEESISHAISEVEAEWNYHANNGTLNKLCQACLSGSRWLINYTDMNLIMALEEQLGVQFQLTKKETILLVGYLDNYAYELSASTEVETRLINLLVINKYLQNKKG